MASPASEPPADSTPQQQTVSRPSSRNDVASSRPVEMATLPASAAEPLAANSTPQTSEPAPKQPSIEISPSEDAQPAQSTQDPSVSIEASTLSRPTAPDRSETEAIGPSTDTPAVKPDNATGPVVVITLLLTTGARHPYKIDERYLKKRNVNVENMDPYNISVYTLKELIWRDWREGVSVALDIILQTIKLTGTRMGDPSDLTQLNTPNTLRTHARRQISPQRSVYTFQPHLKPNN